MSGFVVLRGESNEDFNFPSQDAEIFRDPNALLQRIQRDPGKIPWVAIAPDFADPSGVAQQIRDADPTVSVVLLGADRTEREAAEGILHETRRTLEAGKLASITARTFRHNIGRKPCNFATNARALASEDGRKSCLHSGV